MAVSHETGSFNVVIVGCGRFRTISQKRAVGDIKDLVMSNISDDETRLLLGYTHARLWHALPSVVF